MAQSSFRPNLGCFDQVDKTACYTAGLRGIFFFLSCSNMTMAIGVSQKQEFFELIIFHVQNDQNVKFPQTTHIFEKFNIPRPFSINPKKTGGGPTPPQIVYRPPFQARSS